MDLDPEPEKVICFSNELYKTLYELLDAWDNGYCYTSDDGNRVEDAIVEHARVLLAMPDASFADIKKFLENN